MEPAPHKRKTTNTQAAPSLPAVTTNYDGLSRLDGLGSGDSYYIPGFIEDPNSKMELLRQEIDWLDVPYRGNIMHRKKQAFADQDSNGLIPLYRYPGVFYEVAPWHPVVRKIGDKCQQETRFQGATLNHCIATYYRDGDVTIGFHNDKPRDIEPRSEIWDISLGAKRQITLLRNDHRRAQVIRLQPGSAFVLGPKTNAKWQHAVLAERDVTEPRISLVYRSIVTRYNSKTSEILEVNGVRRKRSKKAKLADE